MGRFEFDATPPRASASAHAGRRDVTNIKVLIRREKEVAQVFVGGQCVASASRGTLQRWLEQPRGTYMDPPLVLRHDGLGVWFEITNHVAPIILARPACTRIVAALKD
jgi:hypothetical protein